MRQPARDNLRRLAGPAAVPVLAGAALALLAPMLARALRRRPPLQFRDRVAVITGGSRGLGRLMARELAAEGARSAILARDPAELEAARRALAALGGGPVLALPCDVRNQEDVQRAIATVVERFGRLDVLINNAGIIQVGPREQMAVADFEDAMAVHFWGPLYATLAALPHLSRAAGGRIVNIASIGGKVAVPHMLPYSASKFALVGLSNGLRSELARRQIHVTTVCPGLMRTGSHVNAQFKGRYREEFSWFAVLGSLPLASIDGRRAARRILEACRRGQPHLILTPQARALSAAAHLAPNLTAHALELADRLLPAPDGREAGEPRPGWASTSRWAPSLLTRLNDVAAVRNNELLDRAALYGKQEEAPR